MPKPRYSIDTSSLIHGWRRIYRPKNFAMVWEKLDTLIAEERLCASIEVLVELKKKDDDLYAWAKERQEALCVELDEACQREVGRIMGAYPRLVDTTKGRSSCDPFVIALANIGAPKLVVVSEEPPGKANSPKIPDVCRGEGLEVIGLADLIEREDWQFR